MVDIRNVNPQKIRYQSHMLYASDPPEIFQVINNTKCKYVYGGNLYGIKLSAEFKKNNSYNFEVTLKDNNFTYKNSQTGLYEEVPYFHEINSDTSVKNDSDGTDYTLVTMRTNDWGRASVTEFYMYPKFYLLGAVDKYYRFKYCIKLNKML